MKRLFLLYVLAFTCLFTGFCQTHSTNKNEILWVNGGVGIYYSNLYQDGVLYNLGLNWYAKNTFYTVRVNYGSEAQIIYHEDPNEYFIDLGALVGKGFYSEALVLNGLVGVGLVGGATRSQYSVSSPLNHGSDSHFDAALLLEANLFLFTSSPISGGLSYFAHLTTSGLIHGLVIKFNLGRIMK